MSGVSRELAEYVSEVNYIKIRGRYKETLIDAESE